MKPVQQLLREHLRTIRPYSSARDEFSIDGPIGGEAFVFLDANENAFGSSAGDSAGPLNRYPDPYQADLKQALAAQRGVGPESLFVGNGSDEAIDLLIRAFCEPKQSSILIAPPTYGMYAVSARIQDALVIETALTSDFAFDPERALAAVRPDTTLCFLCSPNNPSGNLLDAKAVLSFAERFEGLVVVDEAYVEFAPGRSLMSRLSETPNLVILQTLSKAWGLAGIRVGIAAASPEVIGILNLIKPPYNVNRLSQEAALRALAGAHRAELMIAGILEERQRLQRLLPSLECVEHCYPSDANFLLVRMRNARAAYEHLLEHRIVVRDRSTVPGCEECLRITIGTPAENDRLIETLRKLQ